MINFAFLTSFATLSWASLYLHYKYNYMHLILLPFPNIFQKAIRKIDFYAKLFC